MEVETNKGMDSAIGMKLVNKAGSTPFQKRIASIAFKSGDDVTDWMNAGNRATASIKTPKYGLRRRPPKLPSPLVRIPASSISDTPTTMTSDSISRSTYVTLRGSSITPYAYLNSETSRTKSTNNAPDEAVLKKDSTNTDKIPRVGLSQKEVLGPIKRNGNPPSLKAYSSMERNSNGSLEIAKVSESAPLHRSESKKSVLHPTFRHMSYTNRTRTSMEDGEFNINPEPVPYQPQNFMQTPLPRIGPESSTLLKKVPIPKRHLDSFGGYEYSLGSKRGVILHTDRYQWDAPKSFEGMSQRDRLRAELEYMERLRGIKRRREMLPHRAQLDLLMGGKKVEFSERFDIQREIQKLKSLIMPQNARDLFHGKGFHLPDEHSSLRPRRAPMLDYDSDEDSMSPAYLKRSRTNVPSKMDPMVNRSTTLPPNDRQLNLSTRNDAVKRVEIPSAGALPKSRGTEKPEAMVDPDTNPLQIDNLKENLPEEDVAALERIESRLSGRSKLIDSPVKAATPNPLKGSELSHLLPEEKRDELKKTFQKLDTDADGHLMYQQIKSQLPPQMSVQQERFLKQVYDITSSSTFFGVDEFMTMSTLTKKVQDLKSESADSFGNLDFALLHDQIIKYVDLFQSVDRIHSGKISLESLQEVLSAALETDLSADDTNWNKILETVDPDEGAKISKIEFLAHIPYFLSLKLKPGPGALPHSQRFQ
eukprot:XP_011413051.2 PREDICTED: uncharacterized protein LOC105317929 isoform X6 [Crassostrea gigas]